VIAVCVLAALLAALFMRDHPAQVGLRALGDDGSASPASAPPPTVGASLRALGDLLRNRTFLLLAGSFLVCGLSTSGLVQTHFISLCGDYGVPAVRAASVLTLMGLFDLAGTTLSGYLADRYDNRVLLAWYYGLRGLSLLWLPWSDFSLYGLSLFAMFYGLDWIATVPPTVKLSVREFGAERAGLAFGWIYAIHQVGGAIAAYGAGWVRTLLMTYRPALLGAGALCLVAAGMSLVIRAPDRRQPRPA
jgi:predicted MFS family arabinose efflux permease